MKEDYYQTVERYYDDDAGDFDERYWKNPVLQRIRQEFREKVKQYPFTNMLEIGYGTGLDLVHFAKTHPGVRVAGIDISGEMCRITRDKISRHKLSNATAEKGSVEDLEGLFPGQKFDMVYVFFGALNTVQNLELATDYLYSITLPGGKLVMSFVNKYYLAGMLIEMLKFRFRAAFSRLKPEWGGYSPTKYLPSKCFSDQEIRRAFKKFQMLQENGYSILHPAWYYHGLNMKLGRFRRVLWDADRCLNKTPLWRFGEYSLFVFQKPDDID
ncbi:MAG TPA: class I SAM-dependent methyltransferase [Bacteroidales bacterium]|nr:class I SAM-dependent methyltransferase [Bacteroidales bacterium]